MKVVHLRHRQTQHTLCGRTVQIQLRPLRAEDRLCKRCEVKAAALPSTGVVWLDQGVVEVRR